MLTSDSQVSPRESLIHEWEVEEWSKRANHDLVIKKLDVEAKKTELQMKQEEAVRARLHAQNVAEIELKMRQESNKWTQVLRIPILICKIPLSLLLGIAFIIATIKGNDIDNVRFWSALK